MKENKKEQLKVYTYEVVDEQRYKMWWEDLTLVIIKNGVKIKLKDKEIKKITDALPRTVGGVY